MHTRRAAIVALLGLVALPHAAGAQGLFDARGRRERQRPAEEGAASAPDGLDAGEGAAGKFTLPPGARVERDLAYGSDPAQRLDVYIPARRRSAPIILMVHGGAWMLGDKGNTNVVANKVAYWLPKGYIVASTELPHGTAARSAGAGGRRRPCARLPAGAGDDLGSRPRSPGRRSGTRPAPTSSPCSPPTRASPHATEPGPGSAPFRSTAPR